MDKTQTETVFTDSRDSPENTHKQSNQQSQEEKQLQKESHKAAVIEVQKQEETNKEKLEKLVHKSTKILLEVESVFPFTLFPDKLVITEEKVSAIHKIFFYSETVRSVLAADIASVNVQTNPFFATLIIIDRLFTQEPITVSFLKKKEAREARRLIQGMIVTSHQDIDITKIDTPHIKEKLETIGKAVSQAS